MREVINAATASTGGAAVTGAATGQMTIAIISLIALIIFGAWEIGRASCRERVCR